MSLYSVSGSTGVALALDYVQIVDVVDGFGGDDAGFDAVDGGFSVGDVEADAPASGGDDFDF